MLKFRRPLLVISSLYLVLNVPTSSCFALNVRRTLTHPNLSTTYDSKIPISIRGGDSSLFSSVESDEKKVPPPQPTLKELYNFCLPCLGLWISGPLLSLVDTAAVGLTAKPGMGAIELGALGPATTFIDGSTYLFAFLNVATTNLYASALARNAGDDEKAKRATDAVVRTAAKIALICGFGIMSLLFWKGNFLLSLYIGEGSKHIIEPATKYVHIRALSLPTSLVSGVLQAALLGAKDSVSPLVAVLASTITNVLGDSLLVVALKWGTAGAAIATTIAQWAGTAAMVRPTREKLLTVSTPEQRAEHKVSSPDFLAFAAPVLTLILGKLAAFGFMTHVAAALPGEAALASHQVSNNIISRFCTITYAHLSHRISFSNFSSIMPLQIVLSLFFFVSPFLEVISQTAQTFLPQFYVETSAAFNNEAQTLAARLLRLGVCVGGVIAFIAAAVPRFLPFILTNDAMVQASVKPLALPLFLGSLLTAPVAVSEGILLARRELKYLAGIYVLSTILFPFGLLKLKKSGGPVSNIWFGFVLFQLFRATCFTGKLWGRPVLAKVAASLGMRKNEVVPVTESNN
jgi:Na+-driven multidrug efflux pump